MMTSLPSTIVPLICHFLQVRPLLLLSSTNRFFRGLLCPDVRPHPSGPSPPIAFTAECWRYVLRVELRWGRKIPHWRDKDQVVSLEVDGQISPSVTRGIKVALEAPSGPPSQPLPTIADEFAGISLSPELFDTSHLPPAPPLSSAVILYPLIPSLAAMVRSLRFVRQLEYSQSEEGLRVLLTILTVLPSFPLLRHFTLHYDVFPHHQQGSQHPPTAEEREQDLNRSSALVNGLFGCLLSLPSLSSLELHGYIQVRRRHPNRQASWTDQRFAMDVLSTLLRERLIHLAVPPHVLQDWEHQQTRTANAHHSMRRRTPTQMQGLPQAATVGPVPQLTSGMGWFSSFASAPAVGSVVEPQYTSLQSLTLKAGGIPVQRLLHLFPSLVQLHTELGSQSQGEPAFARPQREEVQEGEEGVMSASPLISHCEPALRFFKTIAHIRSLPEMRTLAQFDFLHSLYLVVVLQSTGLGPLTPLIALASLSQLRELTLEVSGGSRRHGIYQLNDEEVFDLTWLDHLPYLRYLHIKAFRHTTLATLCSIGLLPSPLPSSATQFGWSSPSPLPDFVGRVEDFGLDLFDQKVGLSRASEVTFDGWTRLQRCAVHFMALGGAATCFEAERQLISRECEAANAVLRERVGAERWVTEEQLVSERWDSRWKREMASKL